jgi:hypothetical protein
LKAQLQQQVVNLTEDYKTLAASGAADPRLRGTDTVPLCGGGGGNRGPGLGLNIWLGPGGGAILQPGGMAGGLPDNTLDAATLRQAILQLGGFAGGGGLPGNGLDAANIQRKLHMHAQYQLQALQVSCKCFEFYAD